MFEILKGDVSYLFVNPMSNLTKFCFSTLSVNSLKETHIVFVHIFISLKRISS